TPAGTGPRGTATRTPPPLRLMPRSAPCALHRIREFGPAPSPLESPDWGVVHEVGRPAVSRPADDTAPPPVAPLGSTCATIREHAEGRQPNRQRRLFYH